MAVVEKHQKYVNELLDDEEYDQCSDLIDELNTKNNESEQEKQTSKSNYKFRNRNENREPRNPISPMKRNNTSLMEESPKKRIRMPNLSTLSYSANALTNRTTNVRNFNLNKMNNSDTASPTRQKMNLIQNLKEKEAGTNSGEQKKIFGASTPKTNRKPVASRIKELAEQSANNSSAAIERNLSSNWGDIIEELEEQTKELNDYIEKVSEKYKIDKEKFQRNIECDAETLRKRQKKINFGKVTPEYQRYINEIKRKKRDTFHPKTPNKFRKCSRRKFDGLIKKWRKLLHVWDENPELLPELKSSIENSEQGCNEEDMTDDFGGASHIEFSYNVDDYDIIDEDEDDQAAQDVIKPN